jgi:hypothetical protein
MRQVELRVALSEATTAWQACYLCELKQALTYLHLD